MRQFVFADTISDARELRARFRTTSMFGALLLPSRPQIRVGDRVTVQLTIKASSKRVRIGGVVERVDVTSRHSGEERSFRLRIDRETRAKIQPILLDSRASAPSQQRRPRHRVQRWSDCRRGTVEPTRQAQILDASPTGVFLATPLDAKPGEAVLFRLGPSWMAGVVRWQGAKEGKPGVGLELVFSRTEEAHRYHHWYANRVA